MPPPQIVPSIHSDVVFNASFKSGTEIFKKIIGGSGKKVEQSINLRRKHTKYYEEAGEGFLENKVF